MILTLKIVSLLQVQEGPETVCRWAFAGFTRGDKTLGLHSEGMRGRRRPLCARAQNPSGILSSSVILT